MCVHIMYSHITRHGIENIYHIREHILSYQRTHSIYILYTYFCLFIVETQNPSKGDQVRRMLERSFTETNKLLEKDRQIDSSLRSFFFFFYTHVYNT